MSTIFLLEPKSPMVDRIAHWLATNLSVKSVDVSEKPEEQTLEQFIVTNRKRGVCVFTGISDNAMKDLMEGAVGQMDAHRIATVPSGALAADFGLSTIVLSQDIKDYALFSMLAGVKRLVLGREKGGDERPKLPWQ